MGYVYQPANRVVVPGAPPRRHTYLRYGALTCSAGSPRFLNAQGMAVSPAGAASSYASLPCDAKLVGISWYWNPGSASAGSFYWLPRRVPFATLSAADLTQAPAIAWNASTTQGYYAFPTELQCYRGDTFACRIEATGLTGNLGNVEVALDFAVDPETL